MITTNSHNSFSHMSAVKKGGDNLKRGQRQQNNNGEEDVEKPDKSEEKLEEEVDDEDEDWDHGKFCLKKYDESLLTPGR